MGSAVSLYTEQTMRGALRRFLSVDPESVSYLAEGPLEEPLCRACTELLPIVNDRLPGWGAALDILNYHDEMMYGIGKDYDYEEDPVYGIGLSQVVTYIRCLRVYAAARELVE